MAVALGTLRCNATQAFHGGRASQTSQELLSRTPSLHSSETASALPETLLPEFQVLHFLQTQNEWTLLLFKYE